MYLLTSINTMLDYVSVEEKIEYGRRLFDVLYGHIIDELQQQPWNIDTLGMIREYLGTFAQTPEQVHLLYRWLARANQDIHRDFRADNYVLSGFLMKYFQKRRQYNERDNLIYDKYWALYVRLVLRYCRTTLPSTTEGSRRDPN